MLIKSASKIRNNYSEISELCKEKGEPIYLTQNGEGDLVVMDILAFEHIEKTFKVSDELERFHKSKTDLEVIPKLNEKVEEFQD